jgi:hypothetical protein
MDLVPHLRRVHDHIDRHFEMGLDLDHLAGVAGVSKFHFARSFEATYGDADSLAVTARDRLRDIEGDPTVGRIPGVVKQPGRGSRSAGTSHCGTTRLDRSDA